MSIGGIKIVRIADQLNAGRNPAAAVNPAAVEAAAGQQFNGPDGFDQAFPGEPGAGLDLNRARVGGDEFGA